MLTTILSVTISGRIRLWDSKIFLLLFGVASKINLLVIFIDFGVEPLAGTSASLLDTMSIYLSALVAAVRRIRASVNGVEAIDNGFGVEVSMRIVAGMGDLSLFFKGVDVTKLDLLLV